MQATINSLTLEQATRVEGSGASPRAGSWA